MNKKMIARELVLVAREIVASSRTAKKGEVPEAFKKQWKNKDKDNDGKENEPKPDFLKKKKANVGEYNKGMVAISKSLRSLSKIPRMAGGDDFADPVEVEKALRVAIRFLIEAAHMLSSTGRGGPKEANSVIQGVAEAVKKGLK